MDPASPGYGTVPWQQGHPEIKDPNAIEFTMQPVGVILLRHGGKLSEAINRSAWALMIFLPRCAWTALMKAASVRVHRTAKGFAREGNSQNTMLVKVMLALAFRRSSTARKACSYRACIPASGLGATPASLATRFCCQISAAVKR